jgi:hypothetical protein
VADVEVDTEALMAFGQQMLDRLKRRRSIRLIMTGVASTAMRPEPTNGAVCSGATINSGGAGEP